jgi:hypothetical protein
MRKSDYSIWWSDDKSRSSFFDPIRMSTPIYRLKDDHVATCGHVRGLYQKVVDEFHAKNEDIIMGGSRVKGLGFMEPGAPSLNAPDRSDAVPKNFLYDNFA